MRHRAIHAILAGSSLLAASRASAAGEYARLRFELDDPSGKCANEAAFRARVVSRLGYDPFREEAVLDLNVRVVARGPTVRAEITSAQPGKPSGKRMLEDPRCDTLGETLASAVALVLDPVAGAGAPPAPPDAADPLPPPALAPPAGNAPDRPVPPPTPSPERDAALVPAVYADFTTGFARAPTTLLGGRLGAGVRRAWLSVAAEGHVETSLEPANVTPRDRVEASAFSGALVPCLNHNVFQLCSVTTVGSRTVKGLDVLAPKGQRAVFVVLGARGGVEEPLSGAIGLRANAELGVPLLRTTYTVDGIARSTTSVVEVSLAAGVLGRFR